MNPQMRHRSLLTLVVAMVAAISTAMITFAVPAHADDAWSELGSGANVDVYALAADANGNVYAGGGFTTAGGSSANYVAKWNGSTWTALPGISGDVHSLAIDTVGNVYAGGAFGVAKWNGSAWSVIGALASGYVLSLAIDSVGNVYAGGWFTTVNGDPFDNVAKWNGSSWSALGLGTNYDVFALTTDSSGNVYAGGAFGAAGGIVVNRVAKWNGSSWSALGTGMSIGMPDRVYALATDAGGNVYAGGFFTTAGGTSANRVAKWDGSVWSAMGAGMNLDVLALAIDAGGNVYAGGYFTTADGVSANYVARWGVTASSSSSDPSSWITIPQALPEPEGGCSAIADDATVAYGTGVTGGWVRSWQFWRNPPLGGYVCARTLINRGDGWRVEAP